jgi:hypothetical protein
MLEGVLIKSSVLLCVFFVDKNSMQRIFTKKCFLFTVGSVCSVKQSKSGCKCFTDDEEIETEVQKWLRQQSKDFYDVGFDTQV